MPQETKLEGEPAGLRSLADWLRGGLGNAADSTATEVFRQRSQLASGWQGRAGDAFHDRATTLAKSADTLADEAGQAAAMLDALANDLEKAKTRLADIRDAAAGAGLQVSGTLIFEPTPPANPGLQPVDLTVEQAATLERYAAAVDAYNKLVDAWDRAVADTKDAYHDWNNALERAVTTWQDQDDKLVGLAGDLMTGGITGALLTKLAPILKGEADASRTLAGQLARHAQEMVKDGHLIGGKAADYYDMLDRSHAAEARASQYAEAAKDPKLPKGMTRGLGALSVLTTAYGIKSDLDDGESTEQAVVSNVGGTAAGIAAGAGAGMVIGAGVGSVVPVAGTAVGAVGGAIVGTGVGIVTSGAIDSMYENGVDSIGDVGSAIADGGGELVDFGGDMVDAGGDLVDAGGDLVDGAGDVLDDIL